jgi:hypothetical protein
MMLHGMQFDHSEPLRIIFSTHMTLLPDRPDHLRPGFLSHSSLSHSLSQIIPFTIKRTLFAFVEFMR